MKKSLLKIIVVALLFFTVFFSCFDDKPNSHFHIPFKNNADYSIYVYPSSKEQYLAFPRYQDTILQPYYPDPSLDTAHYKIMPKFEDNTPLFIMSAYESVFGYEFDTLLVFIFNADTLEMLGWDTVRAYYKVEQRYDLSLEDLQNVDFKLSFPPTEDMKHIHMWPPYGTYDEFGRRKTNINLISE